MLLFELRISQGNGSINSKEKTNDGWQRRNFICSNTVVLIWHFENKLLCILFFLPSFICSCSSFRSILLCCLDTTCYHTSVHPPKMHNFWGLVFDRERFWCLMNRTVVSTCSFQTFDWDKETSTMQIRSY